MFYLFEVQYGDENDQSKANLIVEASSKSEAIEIIENQVKKEHQEFDPSIDGDNQSVLCL